MFQVRDGLVRLAALLAGRGLGAQLFLPLHLRDQIQPES